MSAPREAAPEETPLRTAVECTPTGWYWRTTTAEGGPFPSIAEMWKDYGEHLERQLRAQRQENEQWQHTAGVNKERHDEVLANCDALQQENERLTKERDELQIQVTGPDGYPTWKDAALAERVRRVAAEQALATAERGMRERCAKEADRSAELCTGLREGIRCEYESIAWNIRALPLTGEGGK